MNIASSPNYIFHLPAGIKQSKRRQVFKKTPPVYLNIFSVRKLRNSLLLQTWTDTWVLSLSGGYTYPFTSHQSSFLFHISWSADFCPWACLIDFQTTPWKLSWWKGVNGRMRGSYFSSCYGALVTKLLCWYLFK